MMLPLLLLLLQSPESAEMLTRQGRQAMARNDSEAARTAFTRAVQVAPKSAQAQFLLGFFHYVENDFLQARPALERAQELAPEDPRTTLFLALTLDGLALPREAESVFEQTLRLEAKQRKPNAETHVAYARMLFSEGRFDEAEKQVSQALVVNPNSREAHYEQARIHLERGRPLHAVKDATLALDLPAEGTTDRQLHFLLSRAHAQAGHVEQAAMHRKAFEAIPAGVVR